VARYRRVTWWHDGKVGIWNLPAGLGVATTTADFEDAEPFEPSKSSENAHFGKLRSGRDPFPSGPRYKLARSLIVLAIEAKVDLLNQRPICMRNPSIGSPSQPCLARLLETLGFGFAPVMSKGNDVIRGR